MDVVQVILCVNTMINFQTTQSSAIGVEILILQLVDLFRVQPKAFLDELCNALTDQIP